MYFVSDSQKGILKLKQQRARLAVAILFCALVTYQGSLSAQSSDNWSFAVSGDSRNCGDIVMPGIAEGVRADKAQSYWHLGDYRATYDFDQDLLAGPAYRGKHLSIADYHRIQWQDFI